MKTLVIIPCGKSKVWNLHPRAGPTPAKNAYTCAPFKVNREYAEKFGDRWVILSARYGFIDPDFIIPEDYNVTFKDPSSNPIKVDELKKQAEKFASFDRIVALGGKDYTGIVEQVFKNQNKILVAPTKGKGLGIALGVVKDATLDSRPF
jgi:hypothetical protein